MYITTYIFSENNQPPIARTNGNVSIHFPMKMAVLNGSSSYDDYRIISYNWTLISGPQDVLLTGVNKSVLQVNQLHILESSPTLYEFKLIVTDYRNLTNSTNVFIIYYKGMLDGCMDGWMDGWMNGWMNGWIDEMDRWMNG